jgi:hypothetical protein
MDERYMSRTVLHLACLIIPAMIISPRSQDSAAIPQSETFAPDDKLQGMDTAGASALQDTTDNHLLKNNPDIAPVIKIEGLILDQETGEAPAGDLPVVSIGSNRMAADSSGAFIMEVERTGELTVIVAAPGYQTYKAIVPISGDRALYVITCSLVKRPYSPAKQPAPTPPAPSETILTGPPWTISGALIDSRFDLAIESDSTVLTFDDDTVPNTSAGNFYLTTRMSGSHVFRLGSPGYQDVAQEIILTKNNMQPFMVIATAPAGTDVVRREITVTARSEPVHATAQVSQTRLSRTEMQRIPSTMSDPVRSINTLPGVAAESDASARPVVRGGDLEESRVYIDGITLIQPYHYGGMRSVLNELAVDNLTLYKSGFPAEYHNAQSAMLVASSRQPAGEPFDLAFNISPLQAAGYVSSPLAGGHAGFYISGQTSFYQWIQKGMMKLAAAMSDDEELSRTASFINLPDYSDISAGFQVKPSPKLKLSVTEMFNNDNFRFGFADSVRYDSLNEEKARLEYDTLLNYLSRYNVLMLNGNYTINDNSILSASLAWQRRWWELSFPETFSDFLDSTIYDVVINQYNLHAGWLYSGMSNHVLKTGIQINYTTNRYNVFLPRMLHEIIINGNTNTADFWGPLTGDSGLTVINLNDSPLYNIMQRLLVRYGGSRNYVDGAVYIQDAWSATDRLRIDGGLRVEASLADTSAGVSPRLSINYSITPRNELVVSGGHYTQNNYSPAAIALATNLTPEKVWHAGIGLKSRLLSWLDQEADIYGKMYYDLLSEMIDPDIELSLDDVTEIITQTYSQTYLDTLSDEGWQALVMDVLMNQQLYKTRYENTGRGLAYGGEYFLRYRATDFWHGWISLSLGRSFRRRSEGWQAHPFPLERPVLISLVNYYRLPRRYELSIKYRFMSGIPYTESKGLDFSGSSDTTYVGPYNEKRYAPYQTLDLKIAKGFAGKLGSGHVNFEIWNSFNSPNMFLLDNKTKKMQSLGFNLPVPMLFMSVDADF